MTVSIIRRRLLAAAGLVSVLSLAACGGGGSDSGTPATWASTSGSDQVTALKITDVSVGTGSAATTGTTATVKYTLWLYDARVATTQKGTQVQTGTFSFALGKGQVISGFDTGVNGMKVGGERLLVIPASLAYGSSPPDSSIPTNAALIFDVQLTALN